MSEPLGARFRRFRTVLAGDFRYHTRRPLFVIWALILGLSAWGMSTGVMQIRSGDATVGGTKAFVTSEFAVAMQLAVVTVLLYGFFVSVAAGMTIIQDDQWRLGELIHATPLRAREYIWGKFAAVLAACVLVLGLHLASMLFFNHVLSNPAIQETRGPFFALNYLRSALLFSIPTIVFLAGISFSIGEWTRRPVLVFVLPVAILLLDIFFLWEWSPDWLDPRLNNLLMWIDVSGYRWLDETWIKVDRGVNFYNNEAIPPDRGFLISRLLFVGLGFCAVLLSGRHFAATLRGATSRRTSRQAADTTWPEVISASEAQGPPLASLGMTTARPSLLGGGWQVARAELIELGYSPGLYLFIPLILLQAVGTTLVDVGYLDTPLLVTSGTFAVRSMGSLALCLCLLLLFYAVESIERERVTRLAAIAYALPIRTGSLLLGKWLALGVVACAITLSTGMAGVIVLLIQKKVGLEFRPFLLVWGLLLAPTVLVWTALVVAIQAITQNRYTTYALGVAILAFTVYRSLTNQINWVGNWPLLDAVRWSDISILELDRKALVLSRVLAVGSAVFLAMLALAWFRRREWDATGVLRRLGPRALALEGLRKAPCIAVPLVAGIWLASEVNRGHDGGAAKKKEKDYWRKNMATYRDAKVPDLKHVALDLDLFPERGRYRVSGTYDLVNAGKERLEEVLLTGGVHWEKLAWTMDDEPFTPKNRAGLYVFEPRLPMEPGKTLRIGFGHEGSYPRGISKKGGGAPEFILPSAVVLTSFSTSIAPVLGYVEDAGVDEENRHDAKEYRDDFYKGQTNSFVGARAPFTTRIKITGPADFTLNSVGTQTADQVEARRRTVVWESDHPVSFFNVVAGRWRVERGTGTAVFYDPAHPYNIAEIRESLDAARRYYSEWFYPYPWRELKLSEFPNLATYAQGFPTNITFSEGIGFLTQSSPELHAAFEITGHEAAHQWWGNLLSPGKGPGGSILSEGTSHFSTILLVEQAKGLNARIDLCKRLEANYGKNRQTDSERPLVKITGERPGDTTVTYDKGGWVFWMLVNQMGRERALAGFQSFIKAYHGNADHPVLQDFLASMRPFAADPAAFDSFTHQWFFEVVVPEYRLSGPKKTANGQSWEVRTRLENLGSGVMPVDVAATRGERFTKDGSASSDYREVRTTATLGAGGSCDVVIACPFEPERVVVDPDAKVLQLRRKSATAKF
jgi:hypothetical protein